MDTRSGRANNEWGEWGRRAWTGGGSRAGSTHGGARWRRTLLRHIQYIVFIEYVNTTRKWVVGLVGRLSPPHPMRTLRSQLHSIAFLPSQMTSARGQDATIGSWRGWLLSPERRSWQTRRARGRWWYADRAWHLSLLVGQ